MKHIKKITPAKANTVEKDTDPMAYVFLQLWASVMSMMLFGAAGGKG